MEWLRWWQLSMFSLQGHNSGTLLPGCAILSNCDQMASLCDKNEIFLLKLVFINNTCHLVTYSPSLLPAHYALGLFCGEENEDGGQPQLSLY